jgi:hypothetical protein
MERIHWVGWRYHFRCRIDFKVEETDGLVLVENLKIS